MMIKKLFGIALAAVCSISVFSAGFQLNEHNTSAMGMGDAYTASVNNASAIYYNQGAMAFLEGTQVNFGSTLILPTFSWTAPDGSQTVDAKDKLHVIPAFYMTKQLNDQVVVGFGNFTPYGLETDWPTGWPGTELSDRIKIQTFYLSPTVAVKLTDNFGIGFSGHMVVSNVLIKKKINFVDSFADVEMAGDDIGWGGSFGFLWKINDKMNFGGSWRSKVKLGFTGDADFDNVPAPFLPVLYDGSIEAGVELPQTWTLGLSYQFSDKLLVEFDLFHTDWSSYRKLEVFRDTGEELASVRKEWENVEAYRFGMRYQLNDEFTLLAGYIYDRTPAPDHTADPSLPDNSRNDVTFGVEWKYNKHLTFSASSMIVLANDRNVTEHYEGFNGFYEATAYLVSFGMDYKF